MSDHGSFFSGSHSTTAIWQFGGHEKRNSSHAFGPLYFDLKNHRFSFNDTAWDTLGNDNLQKNHLRTVGLFPPNGSGPQLIAFIASDVDGGQRCWTYKFGGNGSKESSIWVDPCFGSDDLPIISSLTLGGGSYKTLVSRFHKSDPGHYTIDAEVSFDPNTCVPVSLQTNILNGDLTPVVMASTQLWDVAYGPFDERVFDIPSDCIPIQ